MDVYDQDNQWRCRRCSALLGINREGRLHIRHKRAQLVISGQVLAVCPRCTEINELKTKGGRVAA